MDIDISTNIHEKSEDMDIYAKFHIHSNPGYCYMSHVARSVCLSVCVLVTRVCCAKTAELMELRVGADSYGPREPGIS